MEKDVAQAPGERGTGGSPRRQSPSFLQRAEAECRRYGQDPWVFFRELGQNARDAMARNIQVRTAWTGNHLVLSFADDGRGMTFEHARRYLFRLYASSKEDDPTAAGRYGVGFWSVLRFAPARIEVHSRCKREAWGVSLDGRLESWERVDARRRRVGTTVVLIRSIREMDTDRLRKELHAGLVRTLSHLRTAGRRAGELPVSLDGTRINRPFELESAGSLGFRDGPVEGVVGFGEHPAYRLYARGLPVTEGAFLEELEGKRVRTPVAEAREGAAPVFVLNGNRLDVVLSRQTVVCNRALRNLVDTARRRFDQLVARTVGCTVGRSLPGRILDGLAEMGRRAARAPAALRWATFLLLLLLAGGGLGALVAGLGWFGGDPGDAGASGDAGAAVTVPAAAADGRPGGANGVGAGERYVPAVRHGIASREWISTVEQPGAEPEWALSYAPPDPLLFRLVILDRFDRKRGWQPSDRKDAWHRPQATGTTPATVRVVLGHDGSPGILLVPVPSGYRPVRGSALAAGRKVALEQNRQGLARVDLTDVRASSLSYWLAKTEPAGKDNAPRHGLFSARLPAGAVLPGWLRREVSGLRGLPADERVTAAEEILHRLVRYDRSARVAGAYAAGGGSAERDWIGKVLRIGAGDCDVINGLLVLLLREARIPARLVVGFVGRDGKALPGTHAWVEIEAAGGNAVVDGTRGARGEDEAYADTGSQTPGGAGHDGLEEIPDPGDPGTPMTRVRDASHSPDARAGARLLSVAAASGAGLLVLLLIWSWRLGTTGTARVRITRDGNRRRKLLAEMAIDAIHRPGAWAEVPGLWHSRFLPCHGGKLLSMAQMIRLTGRDRMLVGSRDNPLVDEAVRSGARVLDRSDPVFAGLFARLAGLQDLDELAPLAPRPPPAGPAGALLAAVDALLGRLRTGVSCRRVELEDGRLCRDVDLSAVRLSRRAPWVRRMLGVDTDHPWWRAAARMYADDPRLGLCLAVDRLLQDSRMLQPAAARLRNRAARAAVGEARE